MGAMKIDNVSHLLLFGATGDLSHRMLLPSLFGLHAEGLLPADLAIVATARSDLDDAAFRATVIDALAEHRIFTRLFADRASTIIAISHRLATIEKADVVYMLEDGSIVEQGTHKELVALRGRYFRMFESQLTVPDTENVSGE